MDVCGEIDTNDCYFVERLDFTSYADKLGADFELVIRQIKCV